MNVKRMAIIDAGVLGLVALGGYGFYRYRKVRRAKLAKEKAQMYEEELQP